MTQVEVETAMRVVQFSSIIVTRHAQFNYLVLGPIDGVQGDDFTPAAAGEDVGAYAQRVQVCNCYHFTQGSLVTVLAAAQGHGTRDPVACI